MMQKTAVLFPGQGCQTAGMGASVLTLYPDLMEIYTLGSDVLGFDLHKICMNGSAEDFSQTRFVQPAIYVTCLVLLEAAKRSGLLFEAALGHSLGEYAAMTACGMLSPAEGFRALQLRGEAMDQAAKQSESGMCAILGLAPEEISRICAQTDGYVVPVNFNAPGQTVIAGDLPALDAAAAACKVAGAKKTTRLAVAAAFHSERMADAAAQIRADFSQLSFMPTKVPFYSNLTGDLLAANTDMPAYCADHCTHPVRFTQELTAMQRDGVTRFVELGPKRVLTRLVQQTLPDAEVLFIGDDKGLAALA